MQKLSSLESSKVINSFLSKLKKGVLKSSLKVEYFNLTLQEPFYEKLNCAYIQTADLKEGILYEAVTGRFFYIKAKKGGTPSMSSLTKSVNEFLPKKVKDKLFWVCGNKKDIALEISDFAQGFLLSKH